MYYSKLLATVGLLGFISVAFAANDFTIEQIKVNGAQRVSEQTVLSYLPVKPGDKFTEKRSSELINDLYASGFFSNISLARDGHSLVITVDERPIISKVNVVGNKDIPQNKLDEVLKKMGLVAGEPFNTAILEQLKQALAGQYYLKGRYNAKVTAVVKPEDRKRVAITINVSQGLIAQVKQITLVGNSAFNTSTLLKQLPLSISTLKSIFTHSDQYSKDNFDNSLTTLRNYYLNNGYLSMHVDSSQVTITPDKKYVYIVVHLTEGPQYTFAGFKLTGKLPQPGLTKAVCVNSGTPASRQTVLASVQAITHTLGTKGYAFATVNTLSKVDEAKHTVFITFDVNPGRRYYVRRINFNGNGKTSNIVLRGYLSQFEGALYASNKIDQSIRNLRQLVYLDPNQIEIKPVAVPNVDDQVDLDVQVSEKEAGSATVGGGYSQAYGLLLHAGASLPNFLGTGKTVGVAFNRTVSQKNYSLNYFNPFFTLDGITRNVQLFYENNGPPLGIDTNFTISNTGFNDTYGFPLNNYQAFNLGYSFLYTKLLTTQHPSQEVANFIQKHGSSFYQALLTASWNYNAFDRFLFPTQGDSQNLNLTVSLPVSTLKQPVEYYSLTYNNNFYQPLSAGFIFNAAGTVAYGAGYGDDKTLPFFENFYAGGLGTSGQVRGYVANSLGPQSNNLSQAVGGNLLVRGSAGIIFPSPLVKYNMRTSVFMDVGNVFNTVVDKDDFNLSHLRYSVGVQLEWLTPINLPVIFSLAHAINLHEGDHTELFQFSIGR